MRSKQRTNGQEAQTPHSSSGSTKIIVPSAASRVPLEIWTYIFSFYLRYGPRTDWNTSTCPDTAYHPRRRLQTVCRKWRAALNESIFWVHPVVSWVPTQLEFDWYMARYLRIKYPQSMSIRINTFGPDRWGSNDLFDPFGEHVKHPRHKPWLGLENQVSVERWNALRGTVIKTAERWEVLQVFCDGLIGRGWNDFATTFALTKFPSLHSLDIRFNRMPEVCPPIQCLPCDHLPHHHLPELKSLSYVSVHEVGVFIPAVHFLQQLPLAQLVSLRLSLYPKSCPILATVLRESQTLEELCLQNNLYFDHELPVLSKGVTQRLRSVEFFEEISSWQSGISERLISVIPAPSILAYRHREPRETQKFMTSIRSYGWGQALRVLRVSCYLSFALAEGRLVMRACPNLDELHINLDRSHSRTASGVDTEVIQLLSSNLQARRLHALSLHVPQILSREYINSLRDLVVARARSVKIESRPVASSIFTLHVTPCHSSDGAYDDIALKCDLERLWLTSQRIPRLVGDNSRLNFDCFVFSTYDPWVKEVF